MKAAAALEAERVREQRERLEANIEWLSGPEPKWSCGTKVSAWDCHRLTITWQVWLDENQYRWAA